MENAASENAERIDRYEFEQLENAELRVVQANFRFRWRNEDQSDF